MSQASEDEFRKELREVLEKPDQWYLERVDRAVKGATNVRRRRLQVPHKG
jgi:hypothetical protein